MTTTVIDCGPSSRVSSRSLAWTSSHSLAAACSDKLVRLWSPDGREQGSLALAAPVTVVRWNGGLLGAVAGSECQWWDVRASKSLHKMEVGGGGGIVTLEATTGTWALVTPHRISLYDPRQWNKPVATQETSTRAQAAVFGPNDSLIVATGDAQQPSRLTVWKDPTSTAADNTVSSYPAHTGAVYAMDYHRDGRLATAGSDALVALWNTQHMICTDTWTSPLQFVTSVAWNADRLAYATTEVVRVDDEPATVLEGGGAEALAWHPTQASLLACARADHPERAPVALVTVS